MVSILEQQVTTASLQEDNPWFHAVIDFLTNIFLLSVMNLKDPRHLLKLLWL